MNPIPSNSKPLHPGWPHFAEATGGGWLPIRYWQYWDFAREFAVPLGGRTFVFESAFLEERDEYADYFEVYDLGTNVSLEKARAFWLSPGYTQEPIRRLDMATVLLDSTRKSLLHKDSLPTDLVT